MDHDVFNLTIHIASLPGTVIVLKNVSPEEKVSELIQRLLSRLGLIGEVLDWCLEHDGSALPCEERLWLCLFSRNQTIELTLRRLASTDKETPADFLLDESPGLQMPQHHTASSTEDPGTVALEAV